MGDESDHRYCGDCSLWDEKTGLRYCLENPRVFVFSDTPCGNWYEFKAKQDGHKEGDGDV